ncbi:MAG: hypothetical protein C0616_13235 [Desulfuromonas sp.]|nr:MAG: hypothetical protein C0616_13235 [Desulfuromonas sp.]
MNPPRNTLNPIGLTLATLLTLTVPGPAWAVQSHGGVEGLVSHQIGHILFVVAMAYLLYRLYSHQVKEVGWTEFKIFLWLLFAWNLLTFAGHWMSEHVAKSQFLRVGADIDSFTADGWFDVIFYLTRLDHIILVPAFVFLLIALRKWSAEQ